MRLPLRQGDMAVQRMLVSETTSDATLKPKLLKLLLREYIPDEKRPFGNLSDLSYIVSTVKTNNLLSEQASPTMNQDLIDAWKSATDSWVHRLLSLASNNMLDNCWAGICLLGLTCQECSGDRFLASYSLWLNQLLSHIQDLGASDFLKEASCASLSDLFTRLSRFSSAKKDGISLAARIIHPVLELLNFNNSTVVLEQAVSLLCILINFFQSSVHQHYESVESTIVSRIMSGECSSTMAEKLGYALAVLSKLKRDENSWSLLMVKILVCINGELNDAFQGLEQEERKTKAMRALLPVGKELPPLLFASSESERSALSAARPERLLGFRISTLMQCCCNMLQNSYSHLVSVPVSGLIAIVERVLMVDEISCVSPFSLGSVLKKELIFSEIPRLQLCSLEILISLIEGVRSQLLPFSLVIVQLLNGFLARYKLPNLKIKVYYTLKNLLNALGAGAAIHISQYVISTTAADLEVSCVDGKQFAMQNSASEGLLSASRQKKRKLSIAAEEPSVRNGLEAEMSHDLVHVSVQVAALETLEALLTVGGSMICQNLRQKVDNLLITVASNACKGLAQEDTMFLLSDTSGRDDLQLASLRALLASLLSSGATRPTHLSRAQVLFREGMQQEGTKLSEFCRQALLALESVKYQFALSWLDPHPLSNEFKVPNNALRALRTTEDQQQTPRQSRNGVDELELDKDELNENWLGNEDESEVLLTENQDFVHHTEIPSAPSKNWTPDVSEQSTLLATVNAESHPKATTADESGRLPISEASPMEMDAHHRTESLQTVNSDTAASGKDSLQGNDRMLENVVAEGLTAAPPANAYDQDGSESRSSTIASILERISATLPAAGMAAAQDSDMDSDDQLPDIVDAEPDSDA